MGDQYAESCYYRYITLLSNIIFGTVQQKSAKILYDDIFLFDTCVNANIVYLPHRLYRFKNDLI